LALILLSCTNAAVSAAAEPGLQEIMQELRALKARVGDLEKKLEAAEQRAAKAEQAAASASAAASQARRTSANSLKISQEAAEAKQEQPAGLLSQAAKKIQVYGAVEVEASWQNYKPDSGESNSESGFTLATAELFVEAEINDYTKGLLHLLYEEGDTDYLDVDEAFILIGQTEEVPFYFMGGRIYPAVGLFESYMVSDPITQNVFETQASAAEIGYASGWLNLGLGGYNAGVHEGGDDPDSNINTFYARLQVALPEKIAGDDLSIQAGVAYTNNIAGGNLGEEVPDERLGSLVGGWSAMVQAEYKWLGFAAEYISALDDFAPGELSFAEDDSVRPAAYQIELALMPVDGWTFALRYEGSSDLGDFEPETQWGAAISYDILPDTTLSVEYMRGEYENDDTRDLVTTQLAVGF
jgi:hypothetical protein